MKKFILLLLIIFLNHISIAQQYERLGKGIRTLGQIISMEYDSVNDKLYVAGAFESINGVDCNNIAMYDGISWTDMNGGFPDGDISSIKCINGNLYVGGSFTRAGNNTVKNVAMWDGLSWNTVGNTTVTNYKVMDLAMMNNELYLAAYLTNNGNPGAGLSKWDGNSWQTLAITNLTSGTIKLQSLKDSIMIYGNFTTLNNDSMNCAIYNGSVFNPASFRLNPGGRIIGSGFFSNSLYAVSYTDSLLHWTGNGWNVLSKQAFPSQPLFFSHKDSLYTYINPSSTSNDTNQIWILDNGNFYRKVFENLTGRNTGYPVFTGACSYHNDILLAGYYSSVNSKNLLSISRYDGINISQFASVASTYTSGFPNATVLTTAYDSINNKLYAGGSFLFAGDSAVNNVAEWDGISWKPLGNGLSSTVRKLIIFNGELYAAGNFKYSGSTLLNAFAKWNGSNWQAFGTGADKSVLTMAIHKNNLYIGGSFTTINGQTIENVARFDGTNFFSINNNRLDDAVKNLTSNGDTLFAVTDGIFSFNLIDFSSIAYINSTTWKLFSDDSLSYLNSLFVFNDTLYACKGGVSPITGSWSDNVYAYYNNKWNNTGFYTSYQSLNWCSLFNLNNDLCVGTDEGTFQYKNMQWKKLIDAHAYDASNKDSLSCFIGGFFPYIYDNSALKHNFNNILKINRIKPTVNFSQTLDSICDHQYIVFNTDFSIVSQNFNWNFPGGLPSLSTDASPVIKYNTPGDYDVILKLSNAYGEDSITSINSIHVNNCTVGLNELLSENNFFVYPNPAENAFTIESSSSIKSILIYSITGRLVYESHKILDNKETVISNYWEKGMYFVKTSTNEGSSTVKILIQ